MDTKALNKCYTKMCDKFSAVAVAYENGLATEDQLKKNACAHVGVLMRLKEAESLKVTDLIDAFVEVIKAESKNLPGIINKVCSNLYGKINESKE